LGEGKGVREKMNGVGKREWTANGCTEKKEKIGGHGVRGKG